MRQYLENKTGKLPLFWQIELDGLLLTTTEGAIGEQGKSLQEQVENYEAAFQLYMDEIIKKLKADYIDPKHQWIAIDFEVATYETYLQQREYEKAVAWLTKFEDLIDGSYEDRLIKCYLEEKKFWEAEKYILSNIKKSKLADVIIRQVRYLSVVNPMMCRFMIGNLPAEPQAKDLNTYYRDLSIAQSGIGMLEAANLTVGKIQDFQIQFTYLAHLLDTPNKDIPTQLRLLEQSTDILEQNIWETEHKISNYLLLSKMAQGLGETTIADQLLEKAKVLSEI